MDEATLMPKAKKVLQWGPFCWEAAGICCLVVLQVFWGQETFFSYYFWLTWVHFFVLWVLQGNTKQKEKAFKKPCMVFIRIEVIIVLENTCSVLKCLLMISWINSSLWTSNYFTLLITLKYLFYTNQFELKCIVSLMSHLQYWKPNQAPSKFIQEQALSKCSTFFSLLSAEVPQWKKNRYVANYLYSTASSNFNLLILRLLFIKATKAIGQKS